jgi:hypothetical protein
MKLPSQYHSCITQCNKRINVRVHALLINTDRLLIIWFSFRFLAFFYGCSSLFCDCSSLFYGCITLLMGCLLCNLSWINKETKSRDGLLGDSNIFSYTLSLTVGCNLRLVGEN